MAKEGFKNPGKGKVKKNKRLKKTTKFQKKVENCKETYGYFTKSLDLKSNLKSAKQFA